MIKLYLSGMFRSGTTMIARALNTHKSIAFASDPALEVLKSLTQSLKDDFNFNQPLGDYFYSSENLKYLIGLQKIDLFKIQFNEDLKKKIRPSLKKRCQIYSPKLEKEILKVDGDNYGEFLDDLFFKIKETYNKEKVLISGFKEVWGTEYSYPILNSFSSSKAIVVVRDPRAIVYSKLMQTEQYPIHFLTNQWRKISLIASEISTNKKFKERILVVKYEDIIMNPKITFNEICDFLGIEMDENVLNPENFKNGGDKQWKQNSSHNISNKSFNPKGIFLWKQGLSKEQIQYVEFFCHYEMKLFNYAKEYPLVSNFSNKQLFSLNQINNSPNWLKKNYDMDNIQTYLKYKQINQQEIGSLNLEQIKSHFLFKNIYEKIK